MTRISCASLAATIVWLIVSSPVWASMPHAAEEIDLYQRIRQARNTQKISGEDANKLLQQLRALRSKERGFSEAGKINAQGNAVIEGELQQLSAQLSDCIAEANPTPNMRLEADVERKISAGQMKGRLDFRQAGLLLIELNKIKLDESTLIQNGQYDKLEKAKIVRALQQLQAGMPW